MKPLAVYFRPITAEDALRDSFFEDGVRRLLWLGGGYQKHIEGMMQALGITKRDAVERLTYAICHRHVPHLDALGLSVGRIREAVVISGDGADRYVFLLAALDELSAVYGDNAGGLTPVPRHDRL